MRVLHTDRALFDFICARCVGDQVDSLQYATLATVSRCGMVWFSAAEVGGAGSGRSTNPGTVTNDMLLRHKVRLPAAR